MRTLDQKCANSAYEAFSELKSESKKEKLFRHAKKMPMLIINSGLGNAIMFKYGDYEEFNKHFLKWLKADIQDEVLNCEKIGDQVIQLFLSSREELRQNTVKALKWLEWFNRFAAVEK
ncbi:MAG: type III-B CRISPR module-associated protein Cmr5 [Elusimicrobia bacterium]|nr:type III-B CRISPR module-associated protein Cmr5 [Elusimicrobiota bacterium]